MSTRKNTRSLEGVASRLEMPRRDFLLMGSAAVVGLAATGLPAQVIRGVVAGNGLPILSIGYWPGALRPRADAPAVPARRIIPATSLHHADPRFLAAGARMRVEGFWRAAHHSVRPLSLGLTVRYPGQGPDAQPVTAWSYAATKSSVLANGAAAFSLPVDSGDAIELAFERRRSLRTAEEEKSRRALATDLLASNDSVTGPASFHLRPGTYFFAVRETSADLAPSWSTISVDASAPAAGMLYLDVLGERRPVPFGYVAITVTPVETSTAA
ncbi:MAG TPA: hypothetical protein VJ276_26090 [Thermoanaerobaculia bacterium]|nr:hypothetical protein [Thermoanaerobaculia bacterium]